jgi:hypothetical protein
MTENGNGNDEKTKPERDSKGRFLPGHGGGPGRGKKADEIDLTNLTEDEFWEALEDLNRQDMMSPDVMTRQRAIKLKVMKEEFLHKKKVEGEVEKLTAPYMMELLKVDTLAKNSFGEVKSLRKWLEESLKVCSGCPKFPGKANDEFEFYKGGADG